MGEVEGESMERPLMFHDRRRKERGERGRGRGGGGLVGSVGS